MGYIPQGIPHLQVGHNPLIRSPLIHPLPSPGTSKQARKLQKKNLSTCMAQKHCNPPKLIALGLHGFFRTAEFQLESPSVFFFEKKHGPPCPWLQPRWNPSIKDFKPKSGTRGFILKKLHIKSGSRTPKETTCLMDGNGDFNNPIFPMG